MSTSVPASPPLVRQILHRIPWFALGAVALALAAAWPLIGEPGLLNTRGGGDSPFLLQRVQQLEIALRDGHFPARWMPDANYGFGYPFYNFYAPLSIYIAVIFRFLGSSFVHAIELTQVAGFIAAVWGVYLLAERWYRHRWAALLASVAYTVAPFHMVNVYVRGDSLAEFWAMALYPWVILTADRLFELREGGFPYSRFLAFTLAYAALLLSHNISALIFTPFLLLFLTLRWLGWLYEARLAGEDASLAAQVRLLGPPLLAGLLALALSAWFVIPALAERGLAQLGPVTAGYFHYSNHFRGPDLVQRGFVFEYGVAGGGAFSMGLVQGLAAVIGAVTLTWAAWRQKAVGMVPALFILLTLVVATFMITSWSEWLWDHLPLLSFTQFPWRFLSVQAFAAALAIGALALLPFCRVVSITAVVLLVISGMSGLQTDELLLDDSDVTAERLAQYEWFGGNIGSTVSAEYLPPTMQPRFYTSAWLNAETRDVVRSLSGQLLAVRLRERQTQRQVWEVDVGRDGATAVFPTMAWAGWVAEVDGQTSELRPSPGSGLIALDLPAGVHTVTLKLERTAVRLGAEMLSLAGLLSVLFILYKARGDLSLARYAVGFAALLVGLALILRAWPVQPLTTDNLTWDFGQMAYLHHDQDGVLFNNGVRLQGYEYDRDTVQVGETVRITVVFLGANEDVLTLALGSPALARPDITPLPEPIATETQTLDREMLSFDLVVPEDSPAGLMIPRLTFAVGRPLMPSGQTRGDLFLRPLRVTPQVAVPEARDAALNVQATRVAFRDPEALDVRLAWSTALSLSQNYNASLLLLDEDGSWLAQLDTQPGYGFLPSSEWTPGEWIHDWLTLQLPANTPEGVPLALVARLYEVESGDVMLTRRLGEVTIQDETSVWQENQPLFDLPQSISRQTAVFEGNIRLHGYTWRQDGDTLEVTLYWEAPAPVTEDVTRFVHIFDPETEQIAAQVDGMPRNNSYPPSQWLPGEVVADTVTLDLAGVGPGDFEVGVGFYRPNGAAYSRLTAVDGASGVRFAEDRVPLQEKIER